jgi:uncharacterized MAPEG superfamily protein
MAGLDDLAKDTIFSTVFISLFTVIVVLTLHFAGELGDLTTELVIVYIIEVLLYGILRVLKSG